MAIASIAVTIVAFIKDGPTNMVLFLLLQAILGILISREVSE